MSEAIHEAAARWHQAQLHDDMDWPAFGQWLESDSSHRTAYDDIALLDARIDAAIPLLAAQAGGVDDRRPLGSRRIVAWGMAAAAAIALTVALGTQLRRPTAPAAAPTIYTVGAGQKRTLALSEGVTVALAAGSTLEAPPARNAIYTLRGSAYFDIRHDPARPVTVEIQGYRIRDVGTRFAVSAGPGILSVAVEQGSVSLRAVGEGDETSIAAGQVAIAHGRQVDLRRAGPGPVAAWRSGRFVYDSTPLALVAADIGRFTGRSVLVDAAVARRPFSGVLAAQDGDAMIRAFESLTGLHARRDGETVRLGPGARD
jgi:transmembrane sensor